MIKIIDTTLRDGEQTSGVSFAIKEKLSIARLLLEDLSVDRIEVASARVSDGEFGSVKEIAKWAKSKKMLDRVEVLGFVDGLTSLNWIKDAGCQVINLLCKGSLKHCKYQLKKTVEQHIADIKEVVSNAEKMGISTLVKSGSVNDMTLGMSLGGLTRGVTPLELAEALWKNLNRAAGCCLMGENVYAGTFSEYGLGAVLRRT